MNWVPLFILSGVLVLSGCVQDNSKEATKVPGPSEQPIAVPEGPSETANTPAIPQLPEVRLEADAAVASFDRKTHPLTASTGFVVEKNGPVDLSTEVQTAENQTQATATAPETDGVTAETPVENPSATTPADESAAIGAAFDVLNSAAYTKIIKPLIAKIRSFRPASADLFEKSFHELKVELVPTTLATAAKTAEAQSLVTDWSLPVSTELQLVHLKSKTLIEAALFEATTPDKQAPLLLEAVLGRLAFENQEQKNAATLTQIMKLAQLAAPALLNGRDRLNSRLLYEHLLRAGVSVADWKFETLTAIEASSEVLRIALRKYKMIAVSPVAEFTVPEAEDGSGICSPAISYQNATLGTRIALAQPEWREFDLFLDFEKGPKSYALKNSAAGEQYLDLEVFQKKADGTTYRFTLRYLKTGSGATAGRMADYVVFEKLPAKGAAEKIVMCRLQVDPEVPAASPKKVYQGDRDKDDRDNHRE